MVALSIVRDFVPCALCCGNLSKRHVGNCLCIVHPVRHFLDVETKYWPRNRKLGRMSMVKVVFRAG
jgi:hypothetical protein